MDRHDAILRSAINRLNRESNKNGNSPPRSPSPGNSEGSESLSSSFGSDSSDDIGDVVPGLDLLEETPPADNRDDYDSMDIDSPENFASDSSSKSLPKLPTLRKRNLGMHKFGRGGGPKFGRGGGRRRGPVARKPKLRRPKHRASKKKKKNKKNNIKETECGREAKGRDATPKSNALRPGSKGKDSLTQQLAHSILDDDSFHQLSLRESKGSELTADSLNGVHIIYREEMGLSEHAEEVNDREEIELAPAAAPDSKEKLTVKYDAATQSDDGDLPRTRTTSHCDTAGTTHLEAEEVEEDLNRVLFQLYPDGR